MQIARKPCQLCQRSRIRTPPAPPAQTPPTTGMTGRPAVSRSGAAGLMRNHPPGVLFSSVEDAHEEGGRMPQVLITGGAGFIGSHVADHLLAAGFRVRVL